VSISPYNRYGNLPEIRVSHLSALKFRDTRSDTIRQTEVTDESKWSVLRVLIGTDPYRPTW